MLYKDFFDKHLQPIIYLMPYIKCANFTIIKRGRLVEKGTKRPTETYLGKASKQYVFLVSGKATLMPDVSGE